LNFSSRQEFIAAASIPESTVAALFPNLVARPFNSAAAP